MYFDGIVLNLKTYKSLTASRSSFENCLKIILNVLRFFTDLKDREIKKSTYKRVFTTFDKSLSSGDDAHCAFSVYENTYHTWNYFPFNRLMPEKNRYEDMRRYMKETYIKNVVVSGCIGDLLIPNRSFHWNEEINYSLSSLFERDSILIIPLIPSYFKTNSLGFVHTHTQSSLRFGL